MRVSEDVESSLFHNIEYYPSILETYIKQWKLAIDVMQLRMKMGKTHSMNFIL